MAVEDEKDQEGAGTTEHDTSAALADWRKDGPPLELTLKELSDDLKNQGHLVTVRALRDWGAKGLLPKHVRKTTLRTGKRTVALYPAYTIEVAIDTKYALDSGVSAAELKAESAERFAYYQERHRTIEERTGFIPFRYVKREFPDWPPLPAALRRAAQAYIERVAATLDASGTQQITIRLRLDVEIGPRAFWTSIPVEPPTTVEKRGRRRRE